MGMTLTPKQRRAIWERDERICGICGEPVDWADYEVDHIQARMVGGSETPDNLRATHRRCNRRLGVQDRRLYGIGSGSPGINEERLLMRLDPLLRYRLAALVRRLGLTQSDVVRLAVEEMAHSRSVPPYTPPAPEVAE